MKKNIQTQMEENMEIVGELYKTAKKNSDGSIEEAIVNLDFFALSLKYFIEELKDRARKKGCAID
jgi:hypothetical protein